MVDYYVYALFRRDNGAPFYIGKGRKNRWLAHERDAKPGRSHKDNIICAMRAAGLEVPKAKLAQGLTNAQAAELEIVFIAAIGRHPNGPLTNLTRGGDGCVEPSQEVRDKIAATLTGRKQPRSVVEKRIASNKKSQSGKPHVFSPQGRAAHNAKMAVHMASETWLSDRPGFSMRGRRHSDETKARMRAAALGRILSAETRAKIGDGHRGKKRGTSGMAGKKHSPETRALMSEAHKKLWKDRPNGRR